MTPQEAAQIEARAAARRAVLAKFSDGSAEITEEDVKNLTAPEIHSLINAGRISGIGPDRRLRR